MTEEEVAEGVGEPHWFVAYSHTLQWVGKAAHGWKWEWPVREALEVNRCRSHSGLHQTVLGAHSQGPILMLAAQFQVTNEGEPTCALKGPWCLRGMYWHVTQPRMKQSGFQCMASPMILPGPRRGPL